jgi:hypothetical protein
MLAMKSRLAAIAAARVAEYRATRRGALAEAQAALWQALLRGDLLEAMRQASIVRAIRGPAPESPLVPEILRRLELMQEHRRLWPCNAQP